MALSSPAHSSDQPLNNDEHAVLSVVVEITLEKKTQTETVCFGCAVLVVVMVELHSDSTTSCSLNVVLISALVQIKTLKESKVLY